MNDLDRINRALSEGDLDTCAELLEQYCTVHKSSSFYIQLAMVHKKRGDLEKSEYFFKQAVSLDRRNTAIYLDLALLCDPIMENNEKIEQIRSKMLHNVQSLQKGIKKLTLYDPKNIHYLNFYSAYHGRNEKEINSQIMDFISTVEPKLLYTSEHTKSQPTQKTRIKIGFLSTYLRNHTIGRLFSDILIQLNDQIFEKTLITTRDDLDDLTTELTKKFEHFFFIERNVFTAQLQIESQKFDILLYPEIGMDCFVQLLSLSRLAHVQMVTWGHPITTGSPNIDYFILPKAMSNKTETFRERILELPSPNIYYKMVSSSSPNLFTTKYKLPEGHLYSCPQTLYKFHPNYISIFKGIIKKDPKAIFVLSRASGIYWSKRLLSIWKEHIPNIEQHIYWTPKINRQEFIDMLSICDVMIDPFPFGGGNTVLEALSVDLPVVTLPTDFARCRIAYTLYQTMNYTELIARDIEDYIDLAVRVATDSSQKYKTHIREKKTVLYENEQFVIDFQNGILQVWNNLF